MGDWSVICGDFNVKPDSETLTILRSDEMVELVTHHWAEIFTSRKMASSSYVRTPDIGAVQFQTCTDVWIEPKLTVPASHIEV